jgi:hypothetical protein
MIIGLRHEDKNAWERRVPLTPDDVAGLISTGGITFRVQPSLPTPQRIFPDRAYAEAGAEVTDDLSGCDLVMGVKEMPVDIFRSGKAYMFFSHTMKCQPYNLPMLQRRPRPQAGLLRSPRGSRGHDRQPVGAREAPRDRRHSRPLHKDQDGAGVRHAGRRARAHSHGG